MDVLVLQNQILLKIDQPKTEKDENWKYTDTKNFQNCCASSSRNHNYDIREILNKKQTHNCTCTHACFQNASIDVSPINYFKQFRIQLVHKSKFPVLTKLVQESQ